MFGILRLPDEIRFAPGAVRSAAPAIASRGRRVLVVADPFLATTTAFHALVESLTGLGVDVQTHTDVPPELPVGAVEAAAVRARTFAPDIVVGYGGGSALDAAKLLAVLVTHDAPLSRYYGENAVPGPVVPIVAIPTTAGTGSEVTPVAVVSDPDQELKVGVSSPFLVPRVAIVDPELTVAAPMSVTVHSGVDALVHAIEAYTVRPLDHDLAATTTPVFVGRNALAEPLALEAAGLLFRNLQRAVEVPDDIAARTAMARGSLLAGMAFGASGTHLSHAIQYAVGAMTSTPHGLGTGALLPYVLQAVKPASTPRLAALGRAMGLVDEGDTDDAAQHTVDAVAHLCAGVGLPVSLREIGMTAAHVPRAVDLTMRVERLVRMSPLPADRNTVRRILDAAVAGDRDRLRAATP
ncbi:MAG: iron-containing alcohol dehydrogenase [Pseudoclavibacter sp.]